MKNATRISIGVFSILLLFSCSGSPSSPPVSQAVQPAMLRDSLDYNLYALCVSKKNVKALLNSKSPQPKRIILQFMFDSLGRLTLAAYGGNEKNNQYDSSICPILIPITSCRPSCNLGDIFHKNVYLGDQELYKGNGMDTLRNLMDSAIKFIVFTPQIEPDTVILGRSRIKYAIGYTKDDPTITTTDAILSVTQTGLITNPSPPHKGN